MKETLFSVSTGVRQENRLFFDPVYTCTGEKRLSHNVIHNFTYHPCAGRRFVMDVYKCLENMFLLLKVFNFKPLFNFVL